MDTPTSLSKQVLLREVAKRHHLALDENDPILATVTLNELLMEHTLTQLQTMLAKAQEEMSATSQEQVTAAKEIAARMINESAAYIERRVTEATSIAETRMAETLGHYVTQSQQTLRNI